MKKKNSQERYSGRLIKIVVMGDSGVGKTNIINRYCDNCFHENYTSTIGVDFKIKYMTIGDNKIKLQIWDTAGQQRFSALTKTYYKNADAILFCYAINNRSSFQNLQKWLKQVKDTCQNEKIKSIVLANKCDILDRCVSQQQGIAIANTNNSLFLQTSAKTGQGIDQAFNLLVKSIVSITFKKILRFTCNADDQDAKTQNNQIERLASKSILILGDPKKLNFCQC